MAEVRCGTEKSETCIPVLT